MPIQCLVHLIGWAMESLTVGRITSRVEGEHAKSEPGTKDKHLTPRQPSHWHCQYPCVLLSVFLAWLWSSSQVWGAHRKLLVSGNCPSDSWPAFKSKKPIELDSLSVPLLLSLSPCLNTPLPLSCTRRQEATRDRLPQSREPTAGEGEQASPI